MNQAKRRQYGFTLLELLFVVIIIGILATIFIPQLTNIAERAAGAQAMSTLAEVRNAEQQFLPQGGGGGTWAQLNNAAIMGNLVQNEWTYTLCQGGSGTCVAPAPAAILTSVAPAAAATVTIRALRTVGAPANSIRINLGNGRICVFDNNAGNIYQVGTLDMGSGGDADCL